MGSNPTPSANTYNLKFLNSKDTLLLIIILFSLFLSTNLFAEIKVPGSGGINYWDDFEKYYKKQLKKSEKKKQNLIYYGATSGGGWAPGFIIVKEVNDEAHEKAYAKCMKKAKKYTPQEVVDNFKKYKTIEGWKWK